MLRADSPGTWSKTIKHCPKCGCPNDGESTYCSNCSRHIDRFDPEKEKNKTIVPYEDRGY